MLTTIVVAGSIATALTAVFAFRFRAWKAPRRLVAYFSIFFVIELVAGASILLATLGFLLREWSRFRRRPRAAD